MAPAEDRAQSKPGLGTSTARVGMRGGCLTKETLQYYSFFGAKTLTS